MVEDFSIFEDFNEFFAWYMNIVKLKVPEYLTMNSDEIHSAMGLLTKEQYDFTNKEIRRFQRIPKGIELINDNGAGTFYSRWNNQKKTAQIAYPSVAYYWLRYPAIVKAAMQHEIGHIINGDILTKSDPAHSGCINRSMDCRINQNLDYQTLDYINRCLFTFSNQQTELIVPETWMVNKCGLPLVWKNKITWTLIHKAYHDINPAPFTDDEVDEVELKEGTYVKTVVDKGSPVTTPKETFGIITAVHRDILKTEYEVSAISDEEIEALANQDYNFFVELMTSGTVTRVALDIYQYDKTIKEFEIVPVPTFTKAVPKVGDIALMIKDTGDLKEATFGMVISVNADDTYLVAEFNEDLQGIVLSGAADKYFDKLKSGAALFTTNKVDAKFLEDFILRNINPPDAGGTPEPKTTEEVDKPKVGSVVIIMKGESKGKYGVIVGEDDNGFIVNEVSEAVAKAMVSKK